MPHYAIVHKGRVLLTADSWKVGRFNSTLADLNITKTIYPSDQIGVPIQVDQDTKILLYKDIRPPLDPYTQTYTGPDYDITDDMVTATYTVENLSLPIARDIARGRVKAYRKYAQNKTIKIDLPLSPNILDNEFAIDSGYLKPISVTLRLDDQTVNNLSSYSSLPIGQVIKWKFEDQWLDINKDDVLFLVSELNKTRQSFFDIEYAYYKKIDSADLDSLKVIHEEVNGLFNPPVPEV